MNQPLEPTPDLVQTIVAYLRVGSFAEVAAQAAGVPPEVFADWMARGAAPDAPVAFRDFRLTILRTQAQVRLLVEAEVREKKPLDWLRCGPGRSAVLGEGWTLPARSERASAGAKPEVEPLMQAEFQGAVARILAVLAPHPELREQVADALEAATAASPESSSES